MDFQAFKDSVERHARTAGLTDYEMYYSRTAYCQYKPFEGKIDKFTGNTSIGVCLRCLIDGKMGSASTQLLDEGEAARLVEQSIQSARLIDGKDPAFLYRPGEDDGGRPPLPPPPEPAPVPAASEMVRTALELEQRTLRSDPQVAGVAEAAYFFEEEEVRIVNSNGVDKAHRSSMVGGYVEPYVQTDGEKFTATGFFFGPSGDCLEIDSAVREAVEEAIDSAEARSMPSGNYPVLFTNLQMATLLETFFPVFSAENAQKGLSLLDGREGEAVASPVVTLLDDPAPTGGPVYSAFDDEGVPTYQKAVIQNGRLETLLYNLQSAHKAGRITTANGYRSSYAASLSTAPVAFYLQPGEATQEELLEQMGDGVMLCQLKGLHAGANTLSGDFSLDCSGYRIQKGKKAGAVNQITVSGNFYQLLKDITAVGCDLRFEPPDGRSAFGSPCVLVSGLSIAGKG